MLSGSVIKIYCVVRFNGELRELATSKLRWRSGNSDITLPYGTVLGDGSLVLVHWSLKKDWIEQPTSKNEAH